MSNLSDIERARIAGNVAEIKRLMPELVPEIKELHEFGLIEGWRAVENVGPLRPPDPGAITLDKMLIGPFNPKNKD